MTPTMNAQRKKTPTVPPPGWERYFSTTFDREYFVHVQTKHRQWEYPTSSEVDDPIAAKKRRDEAETKKQQAEALRLQEEAKLQKKEDELQKSYQIAIQQSNEDAMQRKLVASNEYQDQAVDENCIKIYADGLRGLDNDTILQLFKIFGKAFLECRANGGGAALLVMEDKNHPQVILSQR